MKKNNRRQPRKHRTSEPSAFADSLFAAWIPSAQGLQGVPFRSPIANVITVSSPLGPSRDA